MPGVSIAEVEACVARARERGRRQWLAVRRALAEPVDPLLAFAAWRAATPRHPGGDPLHYFERCDAALAFAARGAELALHAEGRDRFREVAARIREESAHVFVVGDGAPAGLPLFAGGFAFADAPGRDPRWRSYPPAAWVLPETLLVRHPGGSHALAITGVEPDARPGPIAERLAARLASLARTLSKRAVAERGGADGPGAPLHECRTRPDRAHAAFRSLVERAIATISRGRLEKVVVARALDLERSEPLAVGRLLQELRRTHPSSACFAVARGESLFLGATPELLVALAAAERRVATRAVAGSAARGREPDEDRALARALRESKKEQEEHASVVRMLREALRPRCGELFGPESPRILALPGIQHLETPLVGRLAPDDAATVVDLAGCLHPTPAVGGAPQGAARRWLVEHEALERGWYAGCLGWVDAFGGGELWVALRSALVCGASSRLYAGAGVVAGSDPERELQETRLKLQTLLAPMLEV